MTGYGDQLLRMVKFSKQFEGQLVPEWKEAFVDYWQLKKDLKKIQILNNNNKNTLVKHSHHSSLSSNFLSSLKGGFSLFGHQHKDHEAIHVVLSTPNICITSLIYLARINVMNIGV